MFPLCFSSLSTGPFRRPGNFHNRTVYTSGEDQPHPVTISALCSSFRLVRIRETPSGQVIILSCVTNVPSRRISYHNNSLVLKTLPLFQDKQNGRTLISWFGVPVQSGAIIRDGDRKSWDARRAMIWDNFSIFRTNCAILTSYIRADPRTCRGLSRGCCHVM